MSPEFRRISDGGDGSSGSFFCDSGGGGSIGVISSPSYNFGIGDNVPASTLPTQGLVAPAGALPIGSGQTSTVPRTQQPNCRGFDVCNQIGGYTALYGIAHYSDARQTAACGYACADGEEGLSSAVGNGPYAQYNPEYGRAVAIIANALLSEAGVLSTTYDDPDIAAAAYVQALGLLSQAFGTEVGSRLVMTPDGWRVGAAISSGSDWSQGIGTVNSLAAPLPVSPLLNPRFTDAGGIHTHPNNLGFSTLDLSTLRFNATYDHDTWIGYIINGDLSISGFQTSGSRSAEPEAKWRVK